MAIVWPCPLRVEAYVAAGREVEVPPPVCPSCAGPLVFWSGYWRHVRWRQARRRRRVDEVSPVPASAGSGSGISAATVAWSVVWRRRRRVVADGVGALVSASQNGQMRHAGSIGFEQE